MTKPIPSVSTFLSEVCVDFGTRSQQRELALSFASQLPDPQNNAVEMNDETFENGTHQGILFSAVAFHDPEYTAWACSQRQPPGQLLRFVRYVELNTRFQGENGDVPPAQRINAPFPARPAPPHVNPLDQNNPGNQRFMTGLHKGKTFDYVRTNYPEFSELICFTQPDDDESRLFAAYLRLARDAEPAPYLPPAPIRN